MKSNLAGEKQWEQTNAGWKVVRSIAMEMDAALAIAGGSFLSAGLTPDTLFLQQAISDDWKVEWDGFFGSMNWYASILETLSVLTGELEADDYSRSTLAIRQTTPEQALMQLRKMADELGIKEDECISAEETFSRLYIQYRKASFASIGFTHPIDPLYEIRLERELRFCLGALSGGALHDRFWHWLDQFYYGVYQPWREGRKEFLTDLEQKLVTVLGSSTGIGKAPNLMWLSDLNPALRYPEIGAAIRSGKLFVNFWLEPFGFSDTFLLLPDKFYFSFAEPGRMYENILAYTRRLAEQVQALADPTRLLILRMIRALSMTNTDMAAYLGLSRPTVSIHAKVLREAGLIRSWDEGRITRHEIDSAEVRKLFENLSKFLDLPPETSGK